MWNELCMSFLENRFSCSSYLAGACVVYLLCDVSVSTRPNAPQSETHYKAPHGQTRLHGR